MSRLRHVGGIAAVLALACAGVALGHGPGHQRGYVATVLEIRPAVPGLTATVLGGDQLLSLRNWSDRTVLVLDAGGRPMFRLGPDGVSRRRGSSWHLVKRGTGYAWHDPRIHWNGAKPPGIVVNAPERMHRIAWWSIPATADGAPIVIYGSLGWVPIAEAEARGAGHAGDGSPGWLVPAVVLGSVLAVGVLALSVLQQGRGA